MSTATKSKPTSWRPLTPGYAARKAALEAKKSPQQ